MTKYLQVCDLLSTHNNAVGKILPHFSAAEMTASEVAGHRSSKRQGLAWNASQSSKISITNTPSNFTTTVNPQADSLQIGVTSCSVQITLSREKPGRRRVAPVCARGGGEEGGILGSPFPLCSYNELHFGPGTRLTVLSKEVAPGRREDGLPRLDNPLNPSFGGVGAGPS